MEVDKVAYMITKFSASPNVATHEEARHLGNESWLGKHYLIDGYTIVWKYMLRATDGP